MGRWTGSASVIGVLLPAMAAASPYADLAARDGYGAVLEAVKASASAAKSDKKLQKELAANGLTDVTMPVKAAFGAELVLTAVSPLGDCAWNGQLTCGFAAQAATTTSPADFQVRCVTRFGGRMDLVATAVPATEGALEWSVHEVEKCWDLGGVALQVLPITHEDLEGPGEGDEFMAPELVELSWREVERILLEQQPHFAVCIANEDGTRRGHGGALTVAFRIAEDGSVASAGVDSSSLDDPEIVDCILRRFERLRFPPPRGGFTEGTFPFTFL